MRTYHDPDGTQVTVREYQVDWSDPATCTEIRMLALQANDEPGNHYLNPQFTVSAPTECDEFNIRVSLASRTWFRTLDRLVRTRGRKTKYKQSNSKEKALGYTGIIVIEGNSPEDAVPLLRKLARSRC